jgi:CheY-like chemotaxis protein
VLESDGWAVNEAEDGWSGLDRIAAQRPALVLLDLMMGELDGFEVVAAPREHPRWSSIPIVAFTARELSDEDRRRLRGQIERIMQEASFSRQDLLREIRSHADAARRSTDGAAGAGVRRWPGDRPCCTFASEYHPPRPS